MSSSGVYNLKLDPDAARELARRGGALVFLDVPPATAIGIDHQTFLVGPNFKGIKMIPPGIHIISYASSGAASHGGGFGPTTAFFINVGAGEVLSWRWNNQEEILQRLEDATECSAFENAVKTFQLDSNLAPYDLHSYPTWRRLAGHVSLAVLDAVAPVGGNINILAENISHSLTGSGGRPTAAEIALDEQLQRNLKISESHPQGNLAAEEEDDEDGAGGGGADTSSNRPAAAAAAASHAGKCFFTPLPRLIKRPGLSPSELTQLNLDKSLVLEDVLSKPPFENNEEIFLGEFQFSFLAFLVGHSLEGFMQWKGFLGLMFSCEDALVVVDETKNNASGGSAAKNKNNHRSHLFVGFLEAFYAQLHHSLTPKSEQQNSATGQEDPSLFGAAMVEEFLSDSSLRRACTRWLRWASRETRATAAPPTEVSTVAKKIAKLLEERAGWECCGPIQELHSGSGGGVGGAVSDDVDVDDDDDDDDDDDGPVVVEMDESGRENYF